MPPKYVFNHIMLFDDETEEFLVYHKKDKRIPKTVDHYGPSPIAKSKSISDAVDSAVAKGVKRWDIYIKGVSDDF